MKRAAPSAKETSSVASNRCADDAASSRDHSAVENIHSSHSLSDNAGSSRLADQVVPASAGDHVAIRHFLQSVSHQPSTAEFQAQLECPSYEPSDRLLIKQGHAIIAHLRLIRREMRFGATQIPVSMLSDFQFAPEHRNRGFEAAILSEAKNAMLRDGSVLGLVQTNNPNLLYRQGWNACSRHQRSIAGPRAILSHLEARHEQRSSAVQSSFPRTAPQVYNIRLWRRMELAALPRIYSENVTNLHGPIVRSSAYWQWLVSRGGNERIYVAIDGPDQFELDETLSPIVGYAATIDGRIVEIMAAADHPEASIQLLARACGDAIERGIDQVELDAPAQDPLHSVLVAANGNRICHEVCDGVVQMALLPNPQQLIRLLGELFQQRAQAAELPTPCELGFLVDNKKFRFCVRRKNVRWTHGKLGRSYLECSALDLAPLFLGHLGVQQAVENGRVRASTRVALEIAETLFPPLSIWRPPWDDLPAQAEHF